jgi:hypothetical protein
VFDALVPSRLLIRMADHVQDQALVPLCIGNVGVVEALECKGFRLTSMNVEFNNSSPVAYMCALTFRGQLSLTFHSQCISQQTSADILLLLHNVLEMVLEPTACTYV